MGNAIARDVMKYARRRKVDNELEEIDVGYIHYKPENLDELLRETKFTRKELKLMYRGYKQVCPTGYVTLPEFKKVFAQMFPLGDSASYATYVFQLVSNEFPERMTFAEIVGVISTVSRGSVSDKLEWTFRLYDIDQDGYINFNDIRKILSSIYDLMGSSSQPPQDPFRVNERAKEIFEKLDLNSDGKITMEEFLQVCEGVLSYFLTDEDYTKRMTSQKTKIKLVDDDRHEVAIPNLAITEEFVHQEKKLLHGFIH